MIWNCQLLTGTKKSKMFWQISLYIANVFLYSIKTWYNLMNCEECETKSAHLTTHRFRPLSYVMKQQTK